VTDYTIASPNGGTWTIQFTNSPSVGRYHDLMFLSEGAAGATNVFKQCRAGILAGPPVAAASKIPGAFAVAAAAGLNFTVQPGPAVVERTTLVGTYGVQSTAVGTAAVATADPSQTRIDSVDLQVLDGALGDNGGMSKTSVKVTTGTPGGGLPAAPINSDHLGSWSVPAGCTSLAATGVWTPLRKSAAIRGAVRILLEGDLLSDPGFDVGELRDTSVISTQGTLDRWDSVSSTWQTLAVLGPGAGYAKYTAAITATGASQTLTQNATTPVQFINAESTCPDVVASGTNNTTFTLNRAGKWAFAVGRRIVVGTTGAHFAQLVRNDTSQIIAAWGPGPLTATNSDDGTMSAESYFATTGISVTLNVTCPAGSNASIGSGAPSTGSRTFLAMQWEGA
jgi:hypothetical protein